MKKGLVRLPSVTATLRGLEVGESIRIPLRIVTAQGLYLAKKRLNKAAGREEWTSRVVEDANGRKWYVVTRDVVSHEGQERSNGIMD